METERCVGACPVCLYLNVSKNCVWSEVGRADLFSKEGHDGEDDKRHEDTVRPELQLVPIHPPGRKITFQLGSN